MHYSHVICWVQLYFGVVPAQAIVETGEAFHQLAEVKDALDNTVKQSFLDPLTLLESKDIKEIMVSMVALDVLAVLETIIRIPFYHTVAMFIPIRVKPFDLNILRSFKRRGRGNPRNQSLSF